MMVSVIAGVIAFMTWLTLGFAQLGETVQMVGTVGAFVAVEGTLVHYVVACMRRHCHHGRSHGHHTHGSAASSGA